MVGLSVLACSRWVWGVSFLQGCDVVLHPSLYFWVTLWVCLFVFSVGREWSMLCLGGSGVLSQGAGFGVSGVCSFSLMRRIVEIHYDLF